MKQCYLCGEELINKRNKTKDHVPPYCIFPQDKPRNLLTIPCCKKCFVPQPSYTFPMEKGLEFRPYFDYGVTQEPNNEFWVLYFYDKLTFSVSVDNPI
jgi:hypothetical protein